MKPMIYLALATSCLSSVSCISISCQCLGLRVQNPKVQLDVGYNVWAGEKLENDTSDNCSSNFSGDTVCAGSQNTLADCDFEAQISFYHPDLMTCVAFADLGNGVRGCAARQRTPDAACSLVEVINGQNQTIGMFSYYAHGKMIESNEVVDAQESTPPEKEL